MRVCDCICIYVLNLDPHSLQELNEEESQLAILSHFLNTKVVRLLCSQSDYFTKPCMHQYTQPYHRYILSV